MRTLLAFTLLSGCILDRTGQSATEMYKRELQAHAAKLETIDASIDKADARLNQLEELTRARGQDEILKMENMDQLREEVSRLRGDLEVLTHDWEQGKAGRDRSAQDQQLRLNWLETRADALEKSLGLKTPPPPSSSGASATVATPAGTGAPTDGTGTPDLSAGPDPAANPVETEDASPEALLKLAEEHLAAGREEAAEAVLNRFLKENPSHALADEAKYRLAEAKFNAKLYPAAVLAFQKVLDEHKDSPWAAWAMLRQGECFEAQGQKQNAKLFYEDTVRLYPKSKAAKEAKAKLGK